MNVHQYKTQRINELSDQLKLIRREREQGVALAVALRGLDSPYVRVAWEFVGEQESKLGKVVEEIAMLRGEL
jgi:type II secretory pathway component PulF